MQDIAEGQGRTVFFVSHNMAAVHQLCTQALLLEKGALVKAGHPLEIIDTYLHSASDTGFNGGRRFEDSIWISGARTLDSKGEAKNRFTHREPIRVSLDCVVAKPVAAANIGIVVKDGKDRVVFRSEQDFPAFPTAADTYPVAATCEGTIPGDLLVPGRYVLTLFIHVPVVKMIFLAEDAMIINIIDAGSAAALYEGKADYGCVFVDCGWQIDFSGKPA
jgi:lipopolysaccharide transport system ATP-binding protein